MATRAIDIRQAEGGDTLFARVGIFLAQHRLSPEPAHYAFAYEIVAHGGGELAREVERLTNGGFRLCASDITQLGGEAVAGCPIDAETPLTMSDEADIAGALVSRALDQLDGFSDTIRAVHAETGDFGRDLKASAAAINAAGREAGVAEITRLTGAMLDRVQHAETRLDVARREADDLREALDEARGSARTDPLTELPNRRAFDEALAALAPGETRALAICDIDHFKAVNDAFGHAVGDRVLKAVAQTLAAELGCLVARWGGEEFAVLFDHADEPAAVVALDRARDALASRRMRVRETGEAIGTISFSAGIAQVAAADARDAALERADRALYRAKQAGRARTDRAD